MFKILLWKLKLLFTISIFVVTVKLLKNYQKLFLFYQKCFFFPQDFQIFELPSSSLFVFLAIADSIEAVDR